MKNLKVVNLVVLTDLKHNFELKKIHSTLPNTEYNPEQFPGLVLRIKKPKTAALLFTSGKVICTGAKTIEEARRAIYEIIKLLKKLNIKITVKPKLKLQNLVGTGELGFNLNLNYLVTKLQNIEYEPEQFPGLVYRIKKPFYACFLLFSNGKVVCTGTKGKNEMKKCSEQLVKDLKKLKIVK